MPSLKSKSKNKIENVVQQAPVIGQYVPDVPDTNSAPELHDVPVPDITDLYCKVILKTGPNKGNKCEFTSANKNGLCKRHTAKTPK